MAELNGKVAVITGGGSGMGKAAAVVFARYGAKVVVADISGREEETAALIGANAIAVRCNVTNEADVEALMATALKTFGRVDSVLNVAGIGVGMRVGDIDMASYDKVMDIDLRGVLLCTKHGIKAMKATGGGTIINWSSTGGLGASPMASIYCMAKAGVISLTKSTALEYGAEGIRTNAICPGPILTEMWGPNPDPARVAMRTKSIPQARLGMPEEVAEVAAFLASDRASFVNGAIIPVDGGQMSQVP